VRQFFRWLKDQGFSDNGRHTYLRAARTWFNFLVHRKVIPAVPRWSTATYGSERCGGVLSCRGPIGSIACSSR
jgi:site-specific recombinase XerD